MTYFLEKNFEIDDDFKINSRPYGWTCIRPCEELNYNDCLDFWSGKKPKNEKLVMSGACAIYDDKQQFHHKTLEEWLIKLSLEENIVPDFEEHMLLNKMNNRYETYIMKIIDLRTGKILEDNTKKIIDYLKKQMI